MMEKKYFFVEILTTNFVKIAILDVTVMNGANQTTVCLVKNAVLKLTLKQ